MQITLLVYVTIYERNVTDGISLSCLRNEQSCFDDKKLISTQYQTLFPQHLVERQFLELKTTLKVTLHYHQHILERKNNHRKAKRRYHENDRMTGNNESANESPFS